MFKEYYLINNKFIPVIKGGKGEKGGCFPADALTMTPDGKYTRIDSLLPGDIIASFDSCFELVYQVITDIYYHPNQSLIKLHLWGGKTFIATPNHWCLTENSTFKELKHFTVGDALIGLNNVRYPIEKIENIEAAPTYNLTISNTNTYIVNDILVHNKGGGKGGGGGGGGGTEADDTLFSTDLLFVLAALGEGPIYCVNPNGAQDIEINEGPIDDLLNIDGDGLINSALFYYAYTTGTVTQGPLHIFGDSVIAPQSLSNPVTLKKGNRPGITAQQISYMSTSVGTSWDQLTFKFNIDSLASMDGNGNIFGNSLSILVSVYDSTGSELLVSTNPTISGKTTSAYKFDVDLMIPIEKRSINGYKFSISKTSDDSTSSKTQDSVRFYGWDEIQYTERAYPRTAVIGYVISATSEYKGNIPTVTNMVKGLLCRVPSNYNQPILIDGQIDWRHVEVDDYNRQNSTYFLQKTGSEPQTVTNPVIYDGLWDGAFIYNWTQNPVWVVYEFLTNKTWGLGIPADNIDKYNFYKVAQYCDAVDQRTGQFIGVNATADGSYRYKPYGMFPLVRQTLLGLPNGSPIKERRFVFDAIISTRKQVMDVINQITASFRGMLFYSAGKLSLNVDMPDELPMAIFNETNIVEGSLVISGTKESDIITGVEVSFIDPLNHYKREVVRVNDDNALREVNHIENVKNIDLMGCTRRSEATRYAQYLLASGKYLRRKIELTSSVEAIQLTVGDIISVSTRITGTSWGYAGRVFANASTGSNSVYLEHFTTPSLSNSIFNANTKPLALRIIKQESDRIDYYLLSNSSFNLINTGNVINGFDVAQVQIGRRYNPTIKAFESSATNWFANNVPVKGDLWTLGEVDPNNIFSSQTDKLFKVTQLERTEEHDIKINAIEYISNVYVDSETQIDYTPVQFTDLSSVLIAPPAPNINLVSRPVRNPDGSVTYVVDINSSTDTTGYPINLSTQYEISYPDEIDDITAIY